MENAEFDTHAANYREMHERNIALSGEEPEYFSDYKMRDFQSLICAQGHRKLRKRQGYATIDDGPEPSALLLFATHLALH